MKPKDRIIAAVLVAFAIASFIYINPKKDSGIPDNPSGLNKRVTREGDREITDYLDKDGVITLSEEVGYAREVKTFFPGSGAVREIRYYDAEGQPVCSKYYGFGQVTETDAYGHAVRTTYVNQNGEPMKAGVGYAMITRSYYPEDDRDRGKVKTEFYFDEKENPVSLSLGNYGTYREYDDLGQNTVSTYLDINENPMMTGPGYATVVRGYHQGYYTEMYYDTEGQPAALSEGQYGIKKENGQTINLDQKGNEQFSLKRTLYNHAWIVILAALLAVFLSLATGKRMNILLLLSYMGIIVYFTLIFRENVNTAVSFNLLKTCKNIIADQEIRSAVLKNIWLFIPLGTILYRLCPKKKVLLLLAGMSVMIEAIQYCSGWGYCETADVINNSLGGLIGFTAGRLAAKSGINRKDQKGKQE